MNVVEPLDLDLEAAVIDTVAVQSHLSIVDTTTRRTRMLTYNLLFFQRARFILKF